jgi:hypothetical protein
LVERGHILTKPFDGSQPDFARNSLFHLRISFAVRTLPTVFAVALAERSGSAVNVGTA